jgi:nucleotide-binding universal stress UspA family protein
VATDFSENAQFALDYARNVARIQGASVVLHHSLDLPDPQTMVGGGLKPMVDVQEAREEAERHLQAEAKRAQLGQMLRATSVGKYRAVDEILQAATEHDCDMVVLGTRGHRGLTRFVMGSVSERVARQCSVPVLIVPLPEPG